VNVVGMQLAAGSRFGPYEVTARIGAGGMGEVYRATDTNLKRQVAIKVLPASLAGDADRIARFRREAELLAALNHPNIAAIHGFERADGHVALVMELVDGPTLADRIAKGAIPLDEALGIASQVTSALEAAHERGIVHRDLKPANVKVRPDGTVKVLDFGLAKSLEPAAAGTGGMASLATITSPAMTQAGMILGTAAYMSPEQARGRPVDKRTDVWAFGCVLFEMLAGVRPFDGDDVTEVLGAVIHKDIDWARLPAATPVTVRTALQRCLEKDPKKRTRDIGDVQLAVDGAFAAPEPPLRVAGAGRRQQPAAIALVLAAVAAAAGAAAAWIVRAPAPPATIALTIDTLATPEPASFALSPDGRHLVFAQVEQGVPSLWIRALDSPTARGLAGTEYAAAPFWSPDSRRVAFFAGDAIRHVAIDGGLPQTVAKTGTGAPLGGTWNAQDVILFARANGVGVFRVPATGDTPAQPVTTLENGEAGHAWPSFLPDGRHFTYLVLAGEGPRTLVWTSLDSAERRTVQRVSSPAWYSPTGHLLFQLEGALVAQRFDPRTGVVSGDPVQVAGDVWFDGTYQSTAIAVSPAGILAYRPQGGSRAAAQLTWLSRDGRAIETVGAPGSYRNMVMDRAGTRVAANTVFDQEDVWVIDIARGTTSRLTLGSATDSDPVFSPDGGSVAYYSTRNSGGIYRTAVGGAGTDELVAATGLQSWPRDWSNDGRFILYQKVRDLWVVPLDGDRKPFPFVATPAQETEGRFSPDGRWVAYGSNETGQFEVFVLDFPAKGMRLQVSTAGGNEPRWRADGRELFYLDPTGRLMSVDVAYAPTFSLGIPRLVFQTRVFEMGNSPLRRYAVSADGTRFLMNVPVADARPEPITVVVNWKTALGGR
jgi:Tol biopolymer transport system component